MRPGTLAPGRMMPQPSQRGIGQWVARQQGQHHGQGMGDLSTSFDELANQVKAFVGDIDLGRVALYGGLAVGAWMLFSAATQNKRGKGR